MNHKSSPRVLIAFALICFFGNLTESSFLLILSLSSVDYTTFDPSWGLFRLFIFSGDKSGVFSRCDKGIPIKWSLNFAVYRIFKANYRNLWLCLRTPFHGGRRASSVYELNILESSFKNKLKLNMLCKRM